MTKKCIDCIYHVSPKCNQCQDCAEGLTNWTPFSATKFDLDVTINDVEQLTRSAIKKVYADLFKRVQPKCETCKHWEHPVLDEPTTTCPDLPTVPLGTCTRITLLSECQGELPIYTALRWHGRYVLPAVNVDTLAFTQDMHEKTDLLTRAEFGCVMHSPKET